MSKRPLPPANALEQAWQDLRQVLFAGGGPQTLFVYASPRRGRQRFRLSARGCSVEAATFLQAIRELAFRLRDAE